MSDDIYYLRSILRHLREFQSENHNTGLGGEALADNIDWLDCYIERLERAAAK